MNKYDPNEFFSAERGGEKPDYIERDALLKAFPVDNYYTQRIRAFPAADVVPANVFKQVVWERDIVLGQLAEIGKGLGAKMDNVRPVVRGYWINDPPYYANGKHLKAQQCSVCHSLFVLMG